jgi:hypothetical protein
LQTWFSVIFFVLLGVVTLLYRFRKESEGNLYLKLLGYFLLGAFTLTVNEFKLPFGFLVFLGIAGLSARPMLNQRIKVQAALLGLLFYLSYALIPVAENYMFERPREIAFTKMGTNVDAIKFTEQAGWAVDPI